MNLVLILQEMVSSYFSSDRNEISCFKFEIRRKLSKLSCGRKGQRSNVKYSEIDLPLSPSVLELFFPLNYDGKDSVKKAVAVTDLNVAFGENWHIFNFPESSTRKRIIGLVTLLSQGIFHKKYSSSE